MATQFTAGIIIQAGKTQSGKQFLFIASNQSPLKEHAHYYDPTACPDKYGCYWGWEPITPEVLEVMPIKWAVGRSF